MKPAYKILLVALLSAIITACSQQGDHELNLDEVLVPVETGESQASLDTPGADEDASSSTPSVPKSPQVTLREKILATSDVPEKALDNAFKYFNDHQSVIRNKDYMIIFDIAQHSGKRRFFLINLKTGGVTSLHTAHGIGSDSDHDGVATSFGNVSGSKKSSLGFMLTAEEYVGKHGGSMRLDGQESRNSKVRSRAIVVHSASYVSPSLSKMGRSEGCPALPLANIKEVIAKTKNGSLFYKIGRAHV